MIETLGEMLVEKPGNFQSVKLWNECRTFVRAADGRPGAGVGSHGDCVIAMAIAQAVRAEMADGKDNVNRGRTEIEHDWCGGGHRRVEWDRVECGRGNCKMPMAAVPT